MADRDEIYEAADRLLADGKRPSLGNVRALLEHGGSYRDIAPILRDWKTERGYRPRPTREDLPAAVETLLVGFAVQAWTAARTAAHAALESDRSRLAEQRKVSEALMIELAMAADAAERRAVESAALASETRDRAAGLEAENLELRRQAAALERRLRRLKADAYWDLVMRTVCDLLPRDGGLTADEIVAHLPPLLGEHAWGQHDPITAAVLKEKMKVRVGAKKYFRMEGDDRFRRLA